MKTSQSVFISGHNGMVGSAIYRAFQKQGFSNIIIRDRKHLDLTNKTDVFKFFKENRPTYVINAAAKVGGIHANNTLPADFIYQNLEIQNNIIHAAHTFDVEKLLFLGSSCIYPKDCPQPMKESHLMTGHLEPTNDAYAIAKIAGIIMCQSYYRQYGKNFLSIMPCNLYGPNDNFDLESSHVLPALIRKFHEAKIQREKTVSLWGTGIAKREFLHVDDMANATLFIMKHVNAKDLYSQNITHLNIGSGKEISIKELAEMISHIVGFTGQIVYDNKKLDGMLLKRLDVSRLHQLGWQHRISLSEGIRQTYNWYQQKKDKQ
jgi:GDP-L-fucose synthase